MTDRSKMPSDLLGVVGNSGAAYFQKIEAKQTATANLDDLDGAATLPEVIDKVNAILAAARR